MRVINVRPDAAACDLMGPAVAAPHSGISWISVVSLFAASPSSRFALGWAKECTVQLFPLAPTVVASCLSVSKHSSGCVATLRCVIGCLPVAPPGSAA